MRYEVNSRIHEAEKRTSLPRFVDASGKDVPYWDHSAKQPFYFNPQPPYDQDWKGLGPRLSVDYAVTSHTVLHAGGAITSLVPNLWQDNFLTGAIPLATTLYASALPNVPLPFQNSVVPVTLPPPYTTAGKPLFPNGDSTHVPPNTQVDLQRYQDDLTALTPGNQVQLLSMVGLAKNFRNGYIESYTAGIKHQFREFKFTVAHEATVGLYLAVHSSRNNQSGPVAATEPLTRVEPA